MVTVKEMLKDVYLTTPELKMVEKKLEETLSSRSLHMSNLSGHMLKGGKRLRPLLVILSASFYEHSTLPLVGTAAAVELIHTASLIHDDIIDRAAQRRGKATINHTWGNRSAVLVGDFLFAKAFELMSRNKNLKILELMTQSIGLMCEGEIEQAQKSWDCRKTEEAYLEQVYKKTSFLISACCRAGGILSHMPQEELEHIADFGLQLGYAYQITDDMLDYSSSNITGKPVENDLAQGTLNHPLLFLIRHPLYKDKVKGIIESRELSPENMEFIRRAIYQCGALEYSYQRAKQRIIWARENLQYLPASYPKKVLLNMADQVIARQK